MKMESYKGEVQRFTPAWLLRGLTRDTPKAFDLDPCFPAGVPKKLIPSYEFTKKQIILPEDGLRASWHGLVFCNPPYTRKSKAVPENNIDNWIAKCKEHNNTIALVYARTGAKWFQTAEPYSMLILKGWIKYIDKKKGTKSTKGGQGSVLLAWGKQASQMLSHAQLEGVFTVTYERPVFEYHNEFGKVER